jgi:hypothetical protein
MVSKCITRTTTQIVITHTATEGNKKFNAIMDILARLVYTCRLENKLMSKERETLDTS